AKPASARSPRRASPSRKTAAASTASRKPWSPSRFSRRRRPPAIQENDMGYVFRTPEQQAAVDGLKRFLDDKIDPIFSRQYRDRFVPRETMAGIMRELTSFGLVSGVVSEAHGGMGIDWLTMIMLFEEVATTACDLSVPVLINSFGAHMLEKLAPPHL